MYLIILRSFVTKQNTTVQLYFHVHLSFTCILYKCRICSTYQRQPHRFDYEKDLQFPLRIFHRRSCHYLPRSRSLWSKIIHHWYHTTLNYTRYQIWFLFLPIYSWWRLFLRSTGLILCSRKLYQHPYWGSLCTEVHLECPSEEQLQVLCPLRILR